MVKTKNQIEAAVKLLVADLANEFHITAVLLFGSYARGTPTEESDIDVALVSPDFAGKDEMDVLQVLSRKAMKINTSLEVVAFTPSELEKPDPRSFSYQVKTYGIPIAIAK
jgi:predicted nucleotidyltransferase